MPRTVPGPYGRNKKVENIMLLLRNSTPSEKRQKDEKTLNLDEYKNQVIDNVIKLFCCCCLVTKSCPNLLRPHSLWPARLLCPWNFPGKNTGVGCHFLLQGVFFTQGSNPRLLIGRQILYH